VYIKNYRKEKKLIIYGLKALAEIAYFYFEKDSVYKVVAFTIEKDRFILNNFKNLKIVPFEEIE